MQGRGRGWGGGSQGVCGVADVALRIVVQPCERKATESPVPAKVQKNDTHTPFTLAWQHCAREPAPSFGASHAHGFWKALGAIMCCVPTGDSGRKDVVSLVTELPWGGGGGGALALFASHLHVHDAHILLIN